MKKILSWVLLACMILTMIPVSIAADGAASTPAEPTIKEAPADATPITNLDDLMLEATDRGNYKLTGDLLITLDMIDAHFADPENPNATPATIRQDSNGDPIYFTDDGKIAYDKVNGETRKAVDKDNKPLETNVKDENGDDVYYVKSTDAAAPSNSIAYDKVAGKTKREYTFSGTLIASADGTAKTEEGNAIWEANKIPLVIYGGGHTLTFEKGIYFGGAGVMINKVYGEVAIYDLTIGTEASPIEADSKHANIGIVAGGVVDKTKGDETIDSKLTVENVDVYGYINEEKRGNNNNNVGGFVGKPDVGTDVVIKNCDSHIDIFRETVKTAGGNQYGGFVGTWKGNTLLIENCNNYGTMQADLGGASSSQGSSAGFVATSREGNAQSTITLRNCVNYGDVFHARVAAGFIGYSKCVLTMENCVNWGEIHQKDSETSEHKTIAAGLVGYIEAGSAAISNCDNKTSSITVDSPDKHAVTSGLIGLIDVDKDKVVLTNVFSFQAADVFTVNAAAVRFDKPTKLRFRASLSASLSYATLVEKYGEGNITVGVKVAKLADVKENGGFEGLADDKVVTTVNEWNPGEAEKKTFIGYSAEIAEADYATEYVAIGFVTVKNAEGVESTIYSAVDEDTARSASEVATAAVADTSTVKVKVTGVKNYVFKIAEKVWSEYTPAGYEKLKGYIVEVEEEETPSDTDTDTDTVTESETVTETNTAAA